jgi:hypothetical protein
MTENIIITTDNGVNNSNSGSRSASESGEYEGETTGTKYWKAASVTCMRLLLCEC